MSDLTQFCPILDTMADAMLRYGDEEGGFGYIPPSEQSISEPATPAKELNKSPRKLKRAMPDDDKENRMSPCSLWKKAKGLDDNGYDAVRNAQGAPTIRSWSSKDWDRFLKEAKKNAPPGNKSPFKDTPQHVRNIDVVSREEGARRYHDVGGDDEQSSLSHQFESDGSGSDADDGDGAALSVNEDHYETGSVQSMIDTQQPEEVEVNDETAGQDCTGDSSDVNGEGNNSPSSPVLNIQEVRGSEAHNVDEEHDVDGDKSIPRRSSESPQPSTASALNAEAVPQVNAKPAIVQERLRTAQSHRQKYGGKRYSPRRHVWTGKEPPRLLLPIIESEDEAIEDNGGRRTRSSRNKEKRSQPKPDAAGGQNTGAAKKRTSKKRGNKRVSTGKREIELVDTQDVEDAAEIQGAEASGSGSNEPEEQEHTNSNAAQNGVEDGSTTVTETTRQEIIRDTYIEVIITGPGRYPESELTRMSRRAEKNSKGLKICPLCRKTPPNGSFMRHLKGFHGEMSYKCKQSGCGEEFKRLDSFERHKERTGH